jgi:hypothetical protein
MRKTLICLCLATFPLHADTDTFRERFADPATRSQALAELVPGTRNFYFHTALDHQLAGRAQAFSKTLAEWKAAAERPGNRVSSAGIAVLENRQLLIDYQKDPGASLAELIRRLDLRFDHTRPDADAAAESLPTRLDPALIAEAAFEKAAAKIDKKAPYKQFEGQRLYRELDHVESFDEAKIRWFLDELDRTDLPGVVALIDRSLSLEKPVAFGQARLHEKLDSTQLAALMELQPKLRSSEQFNVAYLTKLRPGDETDFARDPQAHAAHLQKCRDHVLTLPPALMSLKAHVLHHHLRMQASLGRYPLDDFRAYLALPRQRHPILRTAEEKSTAFIKTDADYSAATGCPEIGDASALIESLLQHFLAKTDSPKDFADHVPEKTLARLHARARLLAGENPARWGTALSPADYKALQEESRIAFAPGAPELLAANDAVKLALDLKNTPELLIRIYELDLPTHFARHRSEPDVDIDLDGLVPHHERRITYAQAPIVQHRETIALPELDGPGAWLVDFISGQVSARALIRKGRLNVFPDRTATAQTLRVFDESGKPVMAASLRLGMETFAANERGLITIPNSPNQAISKGMVVAGRLATPVGLESRNDDLALDARFHLEREQLLADQQATLLLRIQLTNHGHELPLDRIENPALVLKAELAGGVTTERVIAENLTLKPLMEVPFQVPADLLKLTLTLRGSVTPATGGDVLKLSEEIQYELNADLKESRIGTAYFSPVAGGYRLEVRGRNGEPLASRALTLTCHRHDYQCDVKVRVRSDAQGRVDLGRLDTIDYFEVSGEDIGEALYEPDPKLLEPAMDIHQPAGSEIRLPLAQPADAPDRIKLSLLETRDGEIVRDHFEKIAIEDHQLVIRGLPAGTYQLEQGDLTTDILVSSGTEHEDLLVADTRILPRLAPPSPEIRSATAEGDQIRIRLRGHGPDTRVSIIGMRYRHDEWSPGAGIYPFDPPVPDILRPGFQSNGYLTDRRLSDEMRYILDRRAAKTFPGSMLPRPGLLLNRWTEEDMFQDDVLGGEGSEGRGRGSAVPSAMRKRSGGGKGESGPGSAYHPVMDFLARPAVTRFDLTPQADGSLELPLKDFAGCQFLQITASDLLAADGAFLALAASETPLRDRRIARPLDPGKHYLATRSAAVLAKGATASIENLLDADWRAFTTLADAHQFLFGLIPDNRLREFLFLTEWPELKEEKKLDLLSKHACHEFHLFLARKDRPFFDKHVRPLLAHKPEPTFIDDLLMERDLSAHLRPHEWKRLNAAEKALLGQALPAARDRIARELALRWELEAPTPDEETLLFTQTLRGTDLAIEDSLGLARNELREESMDAAGVAFITEKLRRIIIPRIDFEDTSIEEAIDFLRLRATELDSLELDPSRKGISFVIRRPRGASGAGTGSDPGSLRIRELKLRNVPVLEALKYICDQTKLRFKVDDYAITLTPQTETEEDLFTRTFQVPPDFASYLAGESPDETADPFADAFAKPSRLSARTPVIELLKNAGIAFPEGATATLTSSGTLLVRNSAGEMDKVEALTSIIGSSAAAHAASGFRNDDGTNLHELEEDEGAGGGMDAFAASDSDPFAAAAPFGGAALKPRAPRPLLFPERTRLWHESNYCRHTAATDESLIPLNRFWIELAKWDGNGAFLSAHFNACHRSANEALMCLALLDLPFKAERPEVTVDGTSLRVKAREPMILFYKDTRRTDEVAKESPLLVRQSFSPLAERVRIVDGREVENPVSGDFRPGVAYACSLVVTNPTGSGRRIDVLAQIPAGAIPLAGNTATLSSTHEIAPHGVLKLELAFYFPAPGGFAVYPLHVSENGVVLSHTGARKLRVSNDPEPADAASWWVLASEGSDEEVLARLRTANLETHDPEFILWRLQNKEFFQKTVSILRERLYFSSKVAAYGFHHNDPAVIRDYLENSQAVTQLGQWLDSTLLDVRPRVHHDWRTLEFDPLVNARAHRFTGESRLTHEAARDQYHAFLDQLAWKPALDASDHLTLCAFLFLQDRIEEALERFAKIDPSKLPGRLHYDYLHSVALFHQENPSAARGIAARNLPALPPGVWRDRFQTVIDQADEIAALAANSETTSGGGEDSAPQLDLIAGDGGRLVIRHRSLERTTLRLFSVDLEVLFSKDPFLKGDAGTEPAIRPNHLLEVQLQPDVNETSIELPENLRQGSLLASAESGNTRLLRVLDSRAIDLRLFPNTRTLRVTGTATGKPLPKTYIKVYAEKQNGEVVYHKDGYTDLRGSFDYLSHTGVDVSEIKRVAIFANHPEKGARTVMQSR